MGGMSVCAFRMWMWSTVLVVAFGDTSSIRVDAAVAR